jgi:hypothetical protein
MKEKINAMEIVNSIKNYSREVDKMYYNKIDFLGCSEPYCREKIDYLIFKLKTLKGHLTQPLPPNEIKE